MSCFLLGDSVLSTCSVSPSTHTALCPLEWSAIQAPLCWLQTQEFPLNPPLGLALFGVPSGGKEGLSSLAFVLPPPPTSAPCLLWVTFHPSPGCPSKTAPGVNNFGWQPHTKPGPESIVPGTMVELPNNGASTVLSDIPGCPGEGGGAQPCPAFLGPPPEAAGWMSPRDPSTRSSVPSGSTSQVNH